VDSNRLEEGTFNANIKSKGIDASSFDGNSTWFRPLASDALVIPLPEMIDMRSTEFGWGPWRQSAYNSRITATSSNRTFKEGTFNLASLDEMLMYFTIYDRNFIAFGGEVTIIEVTDEIISGRFSIRGRDINDEDRFGEVTTLNGKFKAKLFQNVTPGTH
jgi:hypothetical protein